MELSELFTKYELYFQILDQSSATGFCSLPIALSATCLMYHLVLNGDISDADRSLANLRWQKTGQRNRIIIHTS